MSWRNCHWPAGWQPGAGRALGGVGGGGSGNMAVGAVAGPFGVIRLGPGGDLLGLGGAAGVAEVDAEVIDEVLGDELAELPLADELLAGGEAGLGLGADMAEDL